jgi:hypothetical protein
LLSKNESILFSLYYGSFKKDLAFLYCISLFFFPTGDNDFFFFFFAEQVTLVLVVLIVFLLLNSVMHDASIKKEYEEKNKKFLMLDTLLRYDV